VNNPSGVFEVTNNVTATYSGVVSGDGNITKRGAETAALSNSANTFHQRDQYRQGRCAWAAWAWARRDFYWVMERLPPRWIIPGASFVDSRGISVNGTSGTVRVSNATTNLAFTGAVSGPTLNKTGPGTLTLSGLVSLSDTSHTVAQGTLSLSGPNNNISAGSTISVPAARRCNPARVDRRRQRSAHRRHLPCIGDR